MYLATEKFLKLAQDSNANSLSDKLKTLTQDILNNVKSKNITDKEVLGTVAKLEKLLNSPQSVNPEVLYDVVSELELDLGLNNAAVAREIEPKIADLYDVVTDLKMQGQPNKQPAPAAPAAKLPSTQHASTQAPIQALNQKIDPGVQMAINTAGYTPALATDGILGNETKKGLEWYQETFKIPPMPLNTLLNYIRADYLKKQQENAAGLANKQAPGPTL